MHSTRPRGPSLGGCGGGGAGGGEGVLCATDRSDHTHADRARRASPALIRLGAAQHEHVWQGWGDLRTSFSTAPSLALCTTNESTVAPSDRTRRSSLGHRPQAAQSQRRRPRSLSASERKTEGRAREEGLAQRCAELTRDAVGRDFSRMCRRIHRLDQPKMARLDHKWEWPKWDQPEAATLDSCFGGGTVCEWGGGGEHLVHRKRERAHIANVRKASCTDSTVQTNSACTAPGDMPNTRNAHVCVRACARV
jgi:hypothetical protein